MDASRKKELTERAERKLQHLANNVLEDIAEIQEKQLEATELYRNLSRKQPYSDLEKHFKETEKEIAQIENRIDGKFKVASSSRKRKRR
jgi:ferritin-like metal-binding protein YciE